MSETSPAGRAILVVDPQPDFFESGPLAITGAIRTAEMIAEFLRARGGDYAWRGVTQDWHLDPGGHWSEHPDFVETWPKHCAANSSGAAIHESLDGETWDVVIRKGLHGGAYSGFEGESQDGSTLEQVLKSAGVTELTIVGFATDHCVKATALDGRSLGFQITVALDLCAGVNPETTREAISAMREAGVTIVESKDT
jgi:nicotinamidase/pyrazinamidase